MDGILGGLRWTAALCYIDDVIVFSNILEELALHLRLIFNADIKVNLKFSPNKCHIGYPSLKLLGRKISAEGIEVQMDKVGAILELSRLDSAGDLWHVVGLFVYTDNSSCYSPFCPLP